MVLLDTHIWLWWLLGDGNLKPREREAFDELANNGKLCISWITLWETELLERKERIILTPGFSTWIQKATDPAFLTILPVDLDVLIAQRKLPDSFHADPADRLITATGMLSGYDLATHDRRIIESKSCKIWSA